MNTLTSVQNKKKDLRLSVIPELEEDASYIGIHTPSSKKNLSPIQSEGSLSSNVSGDTKNYLRRENIRQQKSPKKDNLDTIQEDDTQME